MEKKNVIGSKIREARLSESPKATQKDIRDRILLHGVSLSDNSIGKIEKGERPVTDIQILAFSRALNVSIAWLFGDAENK